MDVPILFDYKGEHYAGTFIQVSGGGPNAMFHLMINGFYRGQLWNTKHFGWKFKRMMASLTVSGRILQIISLLGFSSFVFVICDNWN